MAMGLLYERYSPFKFIESRRRDGSEKRLSGSNSHILIACDYLRVNRSNII